MVKRIVYEKQGVYSSVTFISIYTSLRNVLNFKLKLNKKNKNKYEKSQNIYTFYIMNRNQALDIKSHDSQ